MSIREEILLWMVRKALSQSSQATFKAIERHDTLLSLARIIVSVGPDDSIQCIEHGYGGGRFRTCYRKWEGSHSTDWFGLGATLEESLGFMLWNYLYPNSGDMPTAEDFRGDCNAS